MTKKGKDLAKLAGPHQREAKSGMRPEQPGPALVAQPRTDRAPGGFPIVGIGASAGGLAAFEALEESDTQRKAQA